MPFVRSADPATPAAWGSNDQQLVDVGTIVGVDGQPVPRNLCGEPKNLDGGPTPLPSGSLSGAIALVSRGTCTFALKAARVKAAGGIGLVIVDNRPGEANGIPIELAVPAAWSPTSTEPRSARTWPTTPDAPRSGSAASRRSSSPAAAASSRASRPRA